jgi:clan AA aspartic protease
MGHCWVEVEVSNLEKTKSKKLNALADTGATLTVLPEEIAKEIGIEAKEEDIVETGAGPIKVKRGMAWIKIGKKEAPFSVWVSNVVEKVLLGVVVLETLGFEIDPATGKLKERPLLLY